jgi:hypothetical protein
LTTERRKEEKTNGHGFIFAHSYLHFIAVFFLLLHVRHGQDVVFQQVYILRNHGLCALFHVCPYLVDGIEKVKKKVKNK